MMTLSMRKLSALLIIFAILTAGVGYAIWTIDQSVNYRVGAPPTAQQVFDLGSTRTPAIILPGETVNESFSGAFRTNGFGGDVSITAVLTDQQAGDLNTVFAELLLHVRLEPTSGDGPVAFLQLRSASKTLQTTDTFSVVPNQVYTYTFVYTVSANAALNFNSGFRIVLAEA